MKHASWMMGVLVLAMNGSALAAQADGQADLLTPTPTLKAAAVPLPVTSPADDSHRLAITALQQERQSFIQGFNWKSPGDPQALRTSYSQAMERFDVRELELKRDWYQVTGQTELLARAQAGLEARRQPTRSLPEIGGERPSGTQTPSAEVTQ
jgi:hypothetical protein